MLTSRNVHILLLGVILGAASAYVYASARAEARRDQLAVEARASLGSGTEAPHPEITDEEMLAMFEDALAVSPNDPELLTRYATFLFEIRRFTEAVAVFDRVLGLTPEDAEVRTYKATALYASGDRETAMTEFERALSYDPENLLALHNLALGYLDLRGDADAAAEVVTRIQQVDPFYEGIPSLRQRIDAAR